MACAPKSNAAVNAIFAAMDSVKHTQTTVPVHLQDAHYGSHEKLGKGPFGKDKCAQCHTK